MVVLKHKNNCKGRRHSMCKKLTVILIYVFAMFFGSMSFTHLSSFFPQKAEEIGIDETCVGIIIAIYPLSNLITSLALGAKMNSIHPKTLLSLSLVATSLGGLPIGFLMEVHSIWIFYAVTIACRLIQGIGYTGILLASYAMPGQQFTSIVSTVLGILEMSYGVGLAVGPVFSGALFDKFGFKAPFVFQTIFGIVCTASSCLFIEKDEEYNRIEERHIEANDWTVWKLINVPGSMFALIHIFVNMFSVSYVGIALAPYLTFKFGVTDATVGLCFMGFAGVYSLFAPLFGFFVDKKGCYEVVILFGLCLFGIEFLFLAPSLPIPPSFTLSAIITSLTGLSMAFIFVPSIGMCTKALSNREIEVDGSARNLINSAALTSGALGNLLGPLIGGILLNQFGFKMTNSIISTSILTLFILGVIYAIHYRRTKSTPSGNFREI